MSEKTLRTLGREVGTGDGVGLKDVCIKGIISRIVNHVSSIKMVKIDLFMSVKVFLKNSFLIELLRYSNRVIHD